MEPATYLSLALLGGLVGLDAVSCPQAMISRPLVAGPLAGLLLGVPEGGMLAGAVLEILTLRHLPIGAARGWDAGPAAVAAAVVVGVLPTGAAAMVIAVGFGALVGWFGGRTVYRMRQVNAWLVAVEGPITPPHLTARHLAAMGADFLRAALLTLAAILVIDRVLQGVVVAAGGAEILAGLLLVVAVSVTLGADLRTLAPRSVWAAFGAGAAVSAAVFLWLS